MKYKVNKREITESILEIQSVLSSKENKFATWNQDEIDKLSDVIESMVLTGEKIPGLDLTIEEIMDDAVSSEIYINNIYNNSNLAVHSLYSTVEFERLID